MRPFFAVPIRALVQQGRQDGKGRLEQQAEGHAEHEALKHELFRVEVVVGHPVGGNGEHPADAQAEPQQGPGGTGKGDEVEGDVGCVAQQLGLDLPGILRLDGVGEVQHGGGRRRGEGAGGRGQEVGGEVVEIQGLDRCMYLRLVRLGG